MKTLSKLALAVVCYNSAIYFDAADTIINGVDSQTYAASDVISQGWHWGLSATNASWCGQDSACESYDVWGEPWDEWNDPWNNPGWDTDPGDGSGGDHDDDDGGGNSSGEPEETEEEKKERLELYRRCMDQATKWKTKCDENAYINYEIEMKHCDSIREYVEHLEDELDVIACENDAEMEIVFQYGKCGTEKTEDEAYCQTHFGRKT